MLKTLLFLKLLLISSIVYSADGKLIATPGVSQIEGQGGGGLVPMAQLGGYATRDEVAVNLFCSRGNVDDFSLTACGGQVNFFDRLELSIAEQKFHVDPLNLDIEQRILSAKVRLSGDLVFSRYPVISAGIQYKKLEDPTVAFLLGAEEDSGTDFYVASSKLHLGAIGGLNWLWNVALRSTEANQTGLLGFGRQGVSREWVWEASTAVLFGRNLALGIEYREKPDHLVLKEDDWKSVFIAWLPNKYVSVTAAYLDLGDIAGLEEQTGSYFSVTGYF